MGFLTPFINYGKLIGGGILAILALFGWYKYSSKIEQIGELEDYVEQKDKIISAQHDQAVVAEKVHEAEVENVVLEKEVALNEVIVEDKFDKKNDVAQKKIDETPDGVKYEIDA